ncbi:hypothetical protein ABG768_004839, partial [Culter alburnus]
SAYLFATRGEARREPNAVCFPAFPDPRPCQLLSMLLANTATLLRAPAVLLQVGGGDGGWRCPQNPEITKEETELEAKYIPCMNTSLPPVPRPRRDADMQGQISVALWG